MKKFLFLLTFISCVLNAGDSKLFNTDNINNEYTKKYLVGNDLSTFIFSSKFDVLNNAYVNNKKEYEELIKKEQYINCDGGNK